MNKLKKQHFILQTCPQIATLQLQFPAHKLFSLLATCLRIFSHGQVLLHESHLRLQGQYGNLNTKCIIITLFPIYISYSGFYSSNLYMHDMFHMISRSACTCTHTYTHVASIFLQKEKYPLLCLAHFRTLDTLGQQNALHKYQLPCLVDFSTTDTLLQYVTSRTMEFISLQKFMLIFQQQ